MSLRRRTVLTMGALAGAAATSLPLTAVPAAAEEGKGSTVPRGFGDPASGVRPKFRWWWPDALVNTREIADEIGRIAAAGFGGVEIAAVTHSLSQQIDAQRYGWGTPAWTAAVEAALRAAKRHDVVVDLTVGPAW